MVWYVLKLVILLPLIAGLAWGTLKAAQKLQARLGGVPEGTARRARIVETTMLSPTLKLAVIEFHGREILVSASRTGLTRLAEAPAREAGECSACLRALPPSPPCCSPRSPTRRRRFRARSTARLPA